MKDYNLPVYDDARRWIKAKRASGNSWDSIRLACKRSLNDLEDFLTRRREEDDWDINQDDWFKLIESEMNAEQYTIRANYIDGGSMIFEKDQLSAVTVPTDQKSSWVLYCDHLRKKHFREETIKDMEMSTLKILKCLSSDTSKEDQQAVKGLVIGNVQSGKTANMAALMAMAADWGFNFFIILSGTIENLRIQTQRRLLNDLSHKGNLQWRGLEHLGLKCPETEKPQYLHFEKNSPSRFFTVILKNSTRLKNLIQWLHWDKNKKKDMKILVIDDEADQASINTLPLSAKERAKINGLIVRLVKDQKDDGNPGESPFQAMNYIGYTATPYANILSENSNDSLYPQNFIVTLKTSREHFGPRRIFGIEDNAESDGLDIVRTVTPEDLAVIKNIHNGNWVERDPETLIDALSWFLCGAAVMRQREYKRPVSMLIHTSQRIEHHNQLFQWIEKYFENDKEEIIKKCRMVWEKERKEFTLEDFTEQYPDYSFLNTMGDYPDFSELVPHIETLLSIVSPIRLNEDTNMQYNQGIHLCVDNCQNNKATADGFFMRLAYPQDNDEIEYSTAFIVIGGQTLSRGLTIEGLISTYFLRASNQADTLMQMGRWFGYRREYELLPRIWMTDKTISQFRFLSTLDEDLRAEIQMMESLEKKPSEYGPRVLNSSKYTQMRVTSSNKMRAAQLAEATFCGTALQTQIFHNDTDILNDNLQLLISFVNNLGPAEKRKEINKHAQSAAIWRNVPKTQIFEFLKKFQFHERLKLGGNLSALESWIDQMMKKGKLQTWNVVFAGKAAGVPITLQHVSIGKVIRSRLKSSDNMDFIDIKALRSPPDMIADIDLEHQSDEVRDMVRNFVSRNTTLIREKAGMGEYPQLILYVVDRNSSVGDRKSSTRIDLNAPVDLAGLCINIPPSDDTEDYKTRVSIPILSNLFEDESDLPDDGQGVTNEN